MTGSAHRGFEYLSFLTDYGLEDGFVAACHGAAARIAPQARIIDITHLVPPGDIRRGAAVLAQTVSYLPPAVHVAVVDPGVGTARRAVAVAAGQAILVGPDNGLLGWAAAALGGARSAVRLSNEQLWLSPVSATFHGRDIFMPAAAHLAAGLALGQAGEQVSVASLASLPAPASRLRDGGAEGEVMTADRFGNIQLSVRAADARAAGIAAGVPVLVSCAGRQLTVPCVDTFAAGPPGGLVALADSAGYLSLAVNGGSAAARLGLPPGAPIRLSPARRS